MTFVRKTSGRNPGESVGEADALESLAPSLGPDIAAVACQLITRAEAMGLVDPLEATRFDRTLLERALSGFAAAGIGRRVVGLALSSEDMTAPLEQLNRDIEETPSPATEWPGLTHILGLDFVASTAGVSESSARRYLAGSRETPDDVANRLHFIALVVADLLGAYNAFGVRRWFDRPRTALDGKSPREKLGTDWNSSDEGAERVAALARTLLTMGAT